MLNPNPTGTVSLTPEGEVRWQTISVFYGYVQSSPTPAPPIPQHQRQHQLTIPHSGEERWRSDGIQVGGLRSQRGVIGTWFDKDFDSHGPAGPTAFWKICDRGLDEEDAGDSEDEEGIW
jgi:hypothetical protein